MLTHASAEIELTSANITYNEKIVVSIPNKLCQSKVKGSLATTSPDHFCSEEKTNYA